MHLLAILYTRDNRMLCAS